MEVVRQACRNADRNPMTVLFTYRIFLTIVSGLGVLLEAKLQDASDSGPPPSTSVPAVDGEVWLYHMVTSTSSRCSNHTGGKELLGCGGGCHCSRSSCLIGQAQERVKESGQLEKPQRWNQQEFTATSVNKVLHPNITIEMKSVCFPTSRLGVCMNESAATCTTLHWAVLLLIKVLKEVEASVTCNLALPGTCAMYVPQRPQVWWAFWEESLLDSNCSPLCCYPHITLALLQFIVVVYLPSKFYDLSFFLIYMINLDCGSVALAPNPINGSHEIVFWTWESQNQS